MMISHEYNELYVLQGIAEFNEVAEEVVGDTETHVDGKILHVMTYYLSLLLI